MAFFAIGCERDSARHHRVQVLFGLPPSGACAKQQSDSPPTAVRLHQRVRMPNSTLAHHHRVWVLNSSSARHHRVRALTTCSRCHRKFCRPEIRSRDFISATVFPRKFCRTLRKNFLCKSQEILSLGNSVAPRVRVSAGNYISSA